MRSTSAEVPFVDRPREHAEADAVRRASAAHAVDHPAGADRVAVARLEVRAPHAVVHGTTTAGLYDPARQPSSRCVHLIVWTRSRRSARRRAPGSSARSRAPTPAQELGWPAIASGEHTLIQAPTGSGKTLAAFLYGIDRLNADAGRGAAAALRLAAEGAELRRRAQPARPARRARSRSCASPCAPATRRRRSARRCCASPPDILITTPESLFLLLTSRGARDAARRRDADPRRGARRRRHEARRAPRALGRAARPARPTSPFQRIGLSATQRPLEEIGRFVSGGAADPSSSTRARAKELDLEVVVPRRGHARAGAGRRHAGHRSARAARRRSSSIWPSIYPEILRARPRSTARRSSSSTTAASPSGSRCG